MTGADKVMLSIWGLAFLALVGGMGAVALDAAEVISL
jgi:hypothetical protein